MSYKIVVARYNEDIEWLKPEINNCIIYNKGNLLNIENEKILKNVGRESDTYLNYIIENYENLPDIVIFTQAQISDHRHNKNVDYLIELKEESLKNMKSNAYIVDYGQTINGCWNRNWNYINNQFFMPDNYKNNTPIIFEDWFKKNIKNDFPQPLCIYANAIFSVSKKLILKHPKKYYEELIKEVNHNINPVEGHFFERSWYYIFD